MELTNKALQYFLNPTGAADLESLRALNEADGLPTVGAAEAARPLLEMQAQVEQAEGAAKLEEIKAALLEYYAKLEVAELLISGKLEQQLAAYFAFWPIVEQAVAVDTS